MQIHHCRSEKTKAQVGDTGDAATQHGSTATEEKNQTHADPSALVQVEKETAIS